MNGVLYGIGVGPGAPDLLTLRAVAVLGRVDVVLSAASSRNEYSLALEAARPHLRSGVCIRRLDFPMTRDKAELLRAWREAARITQDVLEEGLNAAFLTIGDPLVYSTFGYLMRTLAECAPHLSVRVVPGITSFQAAAARARTVLCESGETLCILPGINSREELEDCLKHADTAVVLKAYRNLSAIRDALHTTGRLENCLLVSQVEQDSEHIRQGIDLAEGVPPYMSLVLSKKPASGR
ncbi:MULTISPECIES: precorrin-2 C(20)-methyltransferase [unclassified Desulfovibrio]|uniref:precorrin-2 C(20)-methyltransferase n=1 Tax=unclassified Desulfovibrio TaxID=2593640 RepID=UPI000F5F98CE|nr:MULTISPECIES: precorrin-2 C(20)-methyltransferase [unclassified Desulfovibrio]RRD71206.1 precorrin-2 C(20)-methyltransferase [Desulfovibrio sp. OH1209_COT-279]RRD87494.1 precorrin-2 C(20)-methyltransferase [Desulfovibrio sp. OH1186_COT-070]